MVLREPPNQVRVSCQDASVSSFLTYVTGDISASPYLRIAASTSDESVDDIARDMRPSCQPDLIRLDPVSYVKRSRRIAVTNQSHV